MSIHDWLDRLITDGYSMADVHYLCLSAADRTAEGLPDTINLLYHRQWPLPVSTQTTGVSCIRWVVGSHSDLLATKRMRLQAAYADYVARPSACSHDPVDTGMRKSWCKKCDMNMEFDGSAWLAVGGRDG